MSYKEGPESILRILVVDDEVNILEILKSFLVGEGYDVSTAAGGMEAMEAIDNYDPHIVLLDIRMPDMDGLQCLRMIKEKKPAIDVIMISGFATTQIARKCLEIGAFDYISKPFCFPHISDVLQKIKITKYLEYI